jgi:hypothetical protein
MATKMEADKKSLNDIILSLQDRERSKAGGFTIENKAVRALPRPSITVSEIHDEMDDGAGVSALTGRGRCQSSSAHRGGCRMTSRPNNSGAMAPPTAGEADRQIPFGARPYADDHERGAKCDHCGIMNHRTDQCRKKKAGLPPSVGRQAAVAGRMDDDGFFYQGIDETA